MKATHLSAVAAIVGLLSPPALAQSRNVELLSSATPSLSFGSEYADIWGYRNPENGKEYALLLSGDGTHVYDCTDPRNPVRRGMIPTERPGSSSNLWQDCKTWSPFAYVVSEAYGGLQIIDLRNPDNPKRLQHWGSTLWTNTHNVALDEGTGLLYATGTGSGTHVIDVKTDPRNPRRIFTLGSPYVHDGSARNGFGYMADQNGNKLRIYDVTLLPGSMPELSQVQMPGAGIAHSAWSTRDDTVCVTANESTGGPVGIFDVADKRLPRLLATYHPSPVVNPDAIPHNVYVEDRVLHVAHYTEGYRVLDLTDPRNPLEVGYYDTYPLSGTGYNGAWGCYHLMPSGVIYVSDRQTGLYVLKPKATSVRYGKARAGSAGAKPTIHTFGAAYLGNPRFRIDAENAPPNVAGIFLLGAGRATVPVLGIELYVALNPAPIVVSLTTNGSGAAAIPIAIPNLGAANGAVLNAQFVFVDSLTPSDFSATQGLEFELFQP
jgi:choice-of-anchor B domain-containing protein